MPLYFAHFLVLQQDFWNSKSPPHHVDREAQLHHIVAQLFEAASADAAYERAIGMVNGFDDAHCDGPGDLTKYYGMGLYELEEVDLVGKPLTEHLTQPYGLEVGAIAWPTGQPVAKLRSELSLFRNRSQTGGSL
jgi:hypothetical protein